MLPRSQKLAVACALLLASVCTCWGCKTTDTPSPVAIESPLASKTEPEKTLRTNRDQRATDTLDTLDGSGSQGSVGSFSNQADAQRSIVVPTSHDDPLVAEPFEETAAPNSDGTPTEKKPADISRPTIDQLFDFALRNHPRLAAYKHEAAAASGRVVQAGLLPNPNLVIDVESPLTESEPTHVSSRLMFTFPLTRKRYWRQQVECAGVERARARLREETELIFAEIAEAAIELLYYQELAERHEEAAELARAAAEARKQRAAAGFADFAAAETTAFSAALACRDTRERLQAARDRLARAAAWPADSPLELKGRLCFSPMEKIGLEQVISTVESRRPNLAAAQAAIAQSRRAYQLARAEAWPDFDIGPRFQGDTDGPDDRLGARFGIDIPIFDRNQGRIAEAEAAYRAALAWSADARQSAAAEAAGLYHAALALQESLDYYSTTVVPAAARLREQLRELEEKRAIEAHQSLELRQRLHRLELEHLERLARYCRLLVRLELLVGRPIAQGPLVM